MMLDKERIDALEQLLEKATPGPLSSHDVCCKQIYEADGYCVATTLSTDDEDYTCGEGRSQQAAQDLKHLIIAAVNALPSLIAHARESLTELERLTLEGQKDYNGMREMQGKFIAASHEIAARDAEIQRLRGALVKVIEWHDRVGRRKDLTSILDAVLAPTEPTSAEPGNSMESPNSCDVCDDTGTMITCSDDVCRERGHCVHNRYGPCYHCHPTAPTSAEAEDTSGEPHPLGRQASTAAPVSSSHLERLEQLWEHTRAMMLLMEEDADELATTEPTNIKDEPDDLTVAYIVGYDHGKSGTASTYADIERRLRAEGMEIAAGLTPNEMLKDWLMDQAKAHREGGRS